MFKAWERQPRQRLSKQGRVTSPRQSLFGWTGRTSPMLRFTLPATAKNRDCLGEASLPWSRPAASLPVLLLFALTMLVCPVLGQDSRKVPISFLPPPMETATYSLGIYDAKSGKLVRRLQEAATESAFTVGLNGLITTWDGKDDAGKAVAPGKYAARGYAVGELKVEGVDILGNDWAADDENLRIKHIEAIALVPADNGVAVLATMADGQPSLMRFSGEGKLLWRKPVSGLSADDQPWLKTYASDISVMPRHPHPDGTVVASVGTFHLEDGTVSDKSVGISEKVMPLPDLSLREGFRPVAPPSADISTTLADPNLSIRSGIGASKPGPEKKTFAPIVRSEAQRSRGKGDTDWTAAGLAGLVQTARDGTVLRRLDVTTGEPLPEAVSASTSQDRLYLLEEKNGWQRVRGLSWVETKEEDGKQISTWQTFFERNLRPDDPIWGQEEPTAFVQIGLVENPLDPGKPQRVKLSADFDDKGSYLTTADGLRLRRISERANLKAVRLRAANLKAPHGLSLFQNDGAAWDEFSIEGAKNMMAFDAGEFEMTVDGEKTHTEKAAEPPDL